jgi:hypothetical protein
LEEDHVMTRTVNRTAVCGVFADRGQAQRAVEELKRVGFAHDRIGVIARDHDPDSPAINAATETKVAEGSVVGAATGAGIGALWALGIAAQVFPPLGVVVGGPLLAFLASAGVGATAGTIIGALVGAGLPEDEARFYEGEIKAGRTLVTVDAGSRSDEAASVLRRSGGFDMRTRDSSRVAAVGM